MKDILQKFKKLENFVVNASAGTISIDKVCLLLLMRRRYIKFAVDLSHVAEVMPQLILQYDILMLSKGADMDSDEQVLNTVEKYVKSVEVIEVRRRLDVWKVRE